MVNPPKGKWHSVGMDVLNPSTTGSFASYDPREFNTEEVIAREALQNSRDAGKDEAGTTKVVFQKLVISGDAKRKFVKLLQLATFFQPRLDAFGKSPENASFRSDLDVLLGRDEISCLLIRDYGTCGLGGEWLRYDRQDHFSRLVAALNLNDKADEDPDSGGSFGLGKSCYANNSRVQTVLYHSVFDPSTNQEGTYRRLMVAGVYPKFSFEGSNYGGFCYFGKERPSEEKFVSPFCNGDAESYWEQIGALFGANLTRQSDQIGTDILLIMDQTDTRKIKKAVEEYYFPAILDGELSVKIIAETGEVVHPDPAGRSDLDQFVELYRAAKSEEENPQRGRLIKPFRKKGGRNLGTIVLEPAEEDEAKTSRKNTVAIMRGTGMVLNYQKIGFDEGEPAVGLFQAHSDVKKFLIASENAAHSEWNINQLKLAKVGGTEGVATVKTINSQIERTFREFKGDLQPKIESSRSDGGLFSKILGQNLKGNTGDAGPEKASLQIHSINMTKIKRSSDVSAWSFRLADNEHTPNEPFQIKVQLGVAIAGDLKRVPIKNIGIRVTDSATGKLVAQGTKPTFNLGWQKNMIKQYTIEYNQPGDGDYLVTYRIENEAV